MSRKILLFVRIALALSLAACSRSNNVTSPSGTSSSGTGSPPAITGIATPSSVAVVTAQNAN